MQPRPGDKCTTCGKPMTEDCVFHGAWCDNCAENKWRCPMCVTEEEARLQDKKQERDGGE